MILTSVSLLSASCNPPAAATAAEGAVSQHKRSFAEDQKKDSAPERDLSWRTPQRIVIVRHGEKIKDWLPGLSRQGCYRAYLLPQFFRTWKNEVVEIFAQQPSRNSGSLRCLETAAPVSAEFGRPLDNSFEKGQEGELAKRILSEEKDRGQTVLVAWEHSAIIDLAKSFGVRLTPSLSRWPGSVFDQAWILTFKPGEDLVPELSIVAQELLPTDISQEQSGIENWGSPEKPGSYPDRVIPAKVLQDCFPDDQSLQSMVRERVVRPLPVPKSEI